MAEGQNPSNKMMTTEMPPDILVSNILPRLPMKCVGRFMCVSRQWHSILTTTQFAKMQLLHQNQDYHQNQKLLLLSTTKPYTFRTIDCETPDKDGLLTASRRLPFKVGSEFCFILASLHGLVCITKILYSDYNAQHTDLILWNPLTSDYKTLSKPTSQSHDDWYWMCCRGQFGLYYTACDDDYKLLCVTHHHPAAKLYIYSLKSDSWRKVETTNSKCIYIDLPTPSVLLNEKLYFLLEKQIYGQHPSYFIMMFDTKTEKLREIATPSKLRREWTEWICLMVLRGSIHLCLAYRGRRRRTIELWRMNGDGDHWANVVTYPSIEPFLWNEKPLHIMRNGDWLMHCEDRVYQRDMNNNHTYDTICTLKTMEINQGWPFKYMETLVSPNNPNRYACHQVITPPSTLLT